MKTVGFGQWQRTVCTCWRGKQGRHECSTPVACRLLDQDDDTDPFRAARGIIINSGASAIVLAVVGLLLYWWLA